MKLGYIARRDLERTFGKEEAERISKLTGWRSWWWQLNYGRGPQAPLLQTIFKILCCAIFGAIVGAIPAPITLAIAAVIILLRPIL